MKKLFPVFLAAVSGTLMFTTSCKKTNSSGQYTCSCTYKGSSTGADTTIKTVYPTGVTQSEASSYCSTNQTTIQIIDPTGTCSL
jgi:hypothetical protein